MLLAIDIGGTYIKHALIADDNQITEEGKVPTPASLEEFLTCLENLIQSNQDTISGVAISCPGEINSRTGFVFRGGLIPYLRNLNLVSRLKELLNLPVTVLNDGEAAGLAEAQLGNLQAINCGATLVLGTGVGFALTSQGALVTPFQYPRYFSKLSEDTSREKRQYQWEVLKRGWTNLWENTGSAVGFVHQASQILQLNEDDGIQVFEQLEQGSHQELQVFFEGYCHEVAILIYNLQSIFALEKVTIGGGISSQPLLIQEIAKQYRKILEQAQHASWPVLEIQATAYQNASNLLGAVCHFKSLLQEKS